jgi:hypothetical protein
MVLNRGTRVRRLVITGVMAGGLGAGVTGAVLATTGGPATAATTSTHGAATTSSTSSTSRSSSATTPPAGTHHCTHMGRSSTS